MIFVFEAHLPNIYSVVYFRLNEKHVHYSLSLSQNIPENTVGKIIKYTYKTQNESMIMPQVLNF